jgi:mannose-6-phosphate isomerase-like protein (cupin superfamily)
MANAIPPVRRVITGIDANGRSHVVCDSFAGNVIAHRTLPAYGISLLWNSSSAPADNSEIAEDSTLAVIPKPAGTSFLIATFPPEAEVNALPPEQRADYVNVSGNFAAMIGGANPRDPRMHATETLDYGVVLAGELTMLLDDEEIVLRAGDTIIQRGATHAWINRGNCVAIMATVVVDAKPHPYR